MITTELLNTKILRTFKVIQHRYIAAMFTKIEKDGFRIYVAWENEDAAKNGFVRWYKASETCLEVSEQQIIKACDYGHRISMNPEIETLLIG